MSIIDIAHIKDLPTNKFMGQKIKQFRKWQNTSIENVAKSLHVPAKTVSMLESGKLINNKLLIKEAHIVGIGNNHLIHIANASKSLSKQASHRKHTRHYKKHHIKPSPLYKRMEAARKRHGWSKVFLGKKAHVSMTSIYNIRRGVKVYPSTMRKLMTTLNIPMHKSNSLHSKFKRLLKRHGFKTVTSFSSQAHISIASLSRFMAGTSSPTKKTTQKMIDSLHVPASVIYNLFGTYSGPKRILSKPAKSNKPAHTSVKINKFNQQTIDDLRRHLTKIDKSLYHQHSWEYKFRKLIDKKIKTAGQHINYNHLQNWIESTVQKSIRKDYNQANISVHDLVLLREMQSACSKNPDVLMIISFILHADTKHLQALKAIINTWND